jgi:hypothetical protein
MQTAESPPPETPPGDDWLRAAFHELHGRNLHGFALLLTLGDVEQAAALSGRAIGAGIARVRELRHPERAAAWLRAHVVRSAGRSRSPVRPRPSALMGLGADAAVIEGLSALGPIERAALIATSIEHLDERDVATIVRRDGARLRHLLATARRRYLAAYLRAAPPESVAGPIADRLNEIGRQTIG